MLDGLDDIDWGALDHAYGPALDTPAVWADERLQDASTPRSRS
ncbi:hypothetical protein ACPPVO_14490 [Dactylosporangium sp. McL0621]